MNVDAMVIEMLAQDEAMLRERVRQLEAERDSYRELLQVALDQLAKLTKTNQTLRAYLRQLRDSHRDERRAA